MSLSRREKAGYGTAELGLAGGELLLQLYLLDYYIRSVGLSPALVGVALALGVLWDAVTDPLMGSLLDRTQSRWGRFMPYILFGGVLFGSALIAVFNPPIGMGEPMVFAYLLFTYILVNTGLTIIGIPHMAMGAVLTEDTHERTELYGWRLMFGTLGLFAGILSPLVASALLNGGEDLSGSRRLGSMLMCLLVVVSMVVTVVSSWDRSKLAHTGGQVAGLREVFSSAGSVLANRAFLPVFAAFMLIAMGRTMNSTLALPYYKDSLGLSESQIQGAVLSTFTLFIVLAIPFWVLLGRHYGKKRPAFIGIFGLGLMTVIAYPLFPRDSLGGPVLAAILGGIFVGAIILVESLITDIADEDFAKNGEPREGLYFGIWRMGQKMARSITLGLSGILLALIGYEESLLQQSASTSRALAWVFGLGVGGLFLAAGIVFLQTPQLSGVAASVSRKTRDSKFNN